MYVSLIDTRRLGAPPGFPLIFALFTQKVGVEGTHSFDYRLYLVAGDRSLSAVDLSVTNLVHSSQAEYADFAVLSPATAFAYAPCLSVACKLPLTSRFV